MAELRWEAERMIWELKPSCRMPLNFGSNQWPFSLRAPRAGSLILRCHSSSIHFGSFWRINQKVSNSSK
eukprot:239182-Alexandrium_andersonii.AAC.1